MNPFQYQRVTTSQAAITAIHTRGAKFLGGGTNLVDLMKNDVEHPTALIDVSQLSATEVTGSAAGLRVGSGVRNSALANHPLVVANYPLLTHAILSGASAQLRNVATTGGNLMQRTRCSYFMDTAFPACNKREPGSGCAAIQGFHRNFAILGATNEGEQSAKTCIATNPGDMSVALYALDAQVELLGADGKSRTVPVTEFHRLAGDDPSKDTVLQPNELIVAVTLPTAKFAKHSWYLKARDRQSYAFALISVAAGLEMDGGTIRSAGLALGGVAHKPWRSKEAEAALAGQPATETTFHKAADALLSGARPLEQNAFKVELAKQCVVRALSQAAKGVQA